VSIQECLGNGLYLRLKTDRGGTEGAMGEGEITTDSARSRPLFNHAFKHASLVLANKVVPAGEWVVGLYIKDGNILNISNAHTNVRVFSTSSRIEGKQDAFITHWSPTNTETVTSCPESSSRAAR
jgi:hypothetical protein